MIKNKLYKFSLILNFIFFIIICKRFQYYQVVRLNKILDLKVLQKVDT
jgi:hypothetical protein